MKAARLLKLAICIFSQNGEKNENLIYDKWWLINYFEGWGGELENGGGREVRRG